jgi:ubiquinone/menaquinone biosynthesis C-methylase UbiE
MISYNSVPSHIIKADQGEICSFISESDNNIDHETVKAFGEEWDRFNDFSDEEVQNIGQEYFDIVTEAHLNQNSLVLDVGCGSGRWSVFASKRARFIEAIDPSDAVLNAFSKTKRIPNIRITKAGVDLIPFPDNSFDFVFSLGVLHHIPDTQKAMNACIQKLKPGGYFLVYLYYDLDNRGILFRSLFQGVNLTRKIISRSPFIIKKFLCDVIAAAVYLPLAKSGKLIKAVTKGEGYKKIPLSYYHDKSFYVMRNDSLDRFGTPLEQRYKKEEIEEMMKKAGLTGIVFSEKPPYWHALGKKIA